ncbi:SCP2 sterol-binding domain-containing protein [Rhodoferax sp. 4810]|uniref:Ubiquinone biosynthesis accessory factor UbiT n=1 Tax=Thiospirillum jenense TaxID=1653858 RepID=A0A839HIJ3_9GAMM|nr:SCP2 sterol-binding domain-containing protein [Thiospirillum jenense]MBB1074545.1 SCP2 sterol-binding domain-containing protein [Rhodoferax jenense]MBB1126519.1 SCP2 sterol-binding domain-containing protein [Thiospirillum jenense]
MSTTERHSLNSPTIPRLLTLPLNLVPESARTIVLAQILNRVFAPELIAGELDFLAHRVMRITIDDARLSYRLTLVNQKLRAAPANQVEDLSIEGNTYEFLLLATRREDPDTLFFNRRLRLGGSTELGLYVKNFLDSLELEQRLGMLLTLMRGATDLLQRFGQQR